MTKVLVVEDSKLIRSILEKFFNLFEIELFIARDGLEGINAYKESQPDIVLMDIDMPIMNGVQATQAIIEYDSKALICMLSAQKEKRNIQTSIMAGARGYLIKPFAQDKIRETLERMLGNKFIEKEQKGVTLFGTNIHDTVKVLIAEDNEFIQSIYSKFLKKYDIHLEFVETGDDALELYQSYKPDIVFMDINMPGISGIEATQIIKQKDSAAKICIVTSQNDIGSMDQAQMAGAVDYLTKPFEEKSLVKLLEETLEVKLQKPTTSQN